MPRTILPMLLLATWHAPAARGTVKIESDDGTNDKVTELVELKLQP